MITKALLQAVLDQYRLPVRGLHGITHWARVLENGKRLSLETGAALEVVALFAVLHDSGRRSEHTDPDHGRRGAEFAASLRGSLIHLHPSAFDLLYHACTYHAAGFTDGDVTVQTCWDSDRLDLGRAGIYPRRSRLCTPAAKNPDVIDWAYARSLDHLTPSWIDADE